MERLYSSNRMKKNGCGDEQTNVSCPHLCPGIRIIDQSWQCAIIWFHNKLQRACEAVNSISIVHIHLLLYDMMRL
jgi:hypothetical protein